MKPRTTVAPDIIWWWFHAFSGERRKNFDMAEKGYIYVPPSCRQAGILPRAHRVTWLQAECEGFREQAGYNRANIKRSSCTRRLSRALHYPTSCAQASLLIAQSTNCRSNSSERLLGRVGYLDTSKHKAAQASPQMRVIGRIIAEVTAADAPAGGLHHKDRKILVAIHAVSNPKCNRAA